MPPPPPPPWERNPEFRTMVMIYQRSETFTTVNSNFVKITIIQSLGKGGAISNLYQPPIVD